MLNNVGYTVICVVGNHTPQPQIVSTGLSKACAGEMMLALENGSFDRFAGEAIKSIQVREDDSTVYLQPDTFFEHRY